MLTKLCALPCDLGWWGVFRYLDIIRNRNETNSFIPIGLSKSDFEAIIYELSRTVNPGGDNNTWIIKSFARTSGVGAVHELYLMGYDSIESASFEVRNGSLLIEY